MDFDVLFFPRPRTENEVFRIVKKVGSGGMGQVGKRDCWIPMMIVPLTAAKAAVEMRVWWNCIVAR